jgi:3-deoxy-D-manno-octulosonic acid kinase
MGLRQVLATLPSGYAVVRGRRGWLAFELSAREELAGAGFGPDGGEDLAASGLSGRRPLGSIEAPGERWIVRSFHHGGWLRFLGERLYLAPARPFRELLLSCRLRSAGFPTPRVVAARAVRAGILGWRLALVSARVEGGIDGAHVLERMRRGELAHSERRRVFVTAGALIGRLHAAGLWHADLNPRNLLFSPDHASAWILDLDRSRIGPPLAPRRRLDNLRRLYRSVRRREARGRSFLRRGDYLRFLRAYLGAADPARSWRADWVALLARERRRAPLHRLGWWLEERLGAGPERRDGEARPGRGAPG